MDSFDALYLLDLHGNAKKKEVAPDGGKDENVFEIQQGVSILLAVKRQGEKKARAKVFHASLWGTQKEKYAALEASDVTSTTWEELTPKSPLYLFTPRDETDLADYEKGWKVTDIFPVNGWGVATRKDYLLVDFEREQVEAKFVDIKKLSAAEAIEKYDVKVSPHWDFAKAQKAMSSDTTAQVKKVLFRPFDFRYFYYEKCMIERGDHRYDLMKNMFATNIALITVRRVETQGTGHFFCSKEVPVLHSVSAKEGNFTFPLYLYTKPTEVSKTNVGTLTGLDLVEVGLEKRANISDKFIGALNAVLSDEETPTPEAIFNYIYARLHGPKYRARYAAFLKTDFPRVPLPASREEFEAFARLGGELVALHTLDSGAAPVLNELRFRPTGNGDNTVERVGWDESAHVLRFNASRGFEGVPRTVWEWKIGGYQVAKKWLDDRKGRTLGFEELAHFQKTLIALDETRRVMEEVEMLEGN